jgi:hypothetical protein
MEGPAKVYGRQELPSPARSSAAVCVSVLQYQTPAIDADAQQLPFGRAKSGIREEFFRNSHLLQRPR